MARVSRSERIAIWQQRLDRFATSVETVTSFCKTEGVSEASFYYWKRRFGTPHRDSVAAQQSIRNQRPQAANRTAAASFAELVVTGQQIGARAQLPNGVSISLGGDQVIAQAIVDQLLAYDPATAGYGSTPQAKSRSAKQSSC